VIVSDLFVRTFLPEDDPIGRHLQVNVDGTGSTDYATVGVAGDQRALMSWPAEPMMYFPVQKGGFERAAIAVGLRELRQLHSSRWYAHSSCRSARTGNNRRQIIARTTLGISNRIAVDRPQTIVDINVSEPNAKLLVALPEGRVATGLACGTLRPRATRECSLMCTTPKRVSLEHQSSSVLYGGYGAFRHHASKGPGGRERLSFLFQTSYVNFE
jgi:hypothetical protein